MHAAQFTPGDQPAVGQSQRPDQAEPDEIPAGVAPGVRIQAFGRGQALGIQSSVRGMNPTGQGRQPVVSAQSQARR